MDWRAISRSRSRISAMDWRPSSRSRSRPPPGQPFDQGNVSNSWSEGKFTSPAFGDMAPLMGTVGGLSRSLDVPFMNPNELATSSSIPIPGIATQLRYGTPNLASSFPSHVQLSVLSEEGPSYSGTALLPLSEMQGAASHPQPFHHPLVSINGPTQQHNSLPSWIGLPSQSRHLYEPSSANGLPPHLRKTSLDHAGNRQFHVTAQKPGRSPLTGLPDSLETSLVSVWNHNIECILILGMRPGETPCGLSSCRKLAARRSSHYRIKEDRSEKYSPQ